MSRAVQCIRRAFYQPRRPRQERHEVPSSSRSATRERRRPGGRRRARASVHQKRTRSTPHSSPQKTYFPPLLRPLRQGQHVLGRLARLVRRSPRSRRDEGRLRRRRLRLRDRTRGGRRRVFSQNGRGGSRCSSGRSGGARGRGDGIDRRRRLGSTSSQSRVSRSQTLAGSQSSLKRALKLAARRVRSSGSNAQSTNDALKSPH